LSPHSKIALPALECGGKRQRDTAFKTLYPKTPLKLLTPLNNQKRRRLTSLVVAAFQNCRCKAISLRLNLNTQRAYRRFLLFVVK
jgi:hypothetical protein